MTATPTFAGRYVGCDVDPVTHDLLIRIAIPMVRGGPTLDEIARWSTGMRDAPVVIAVGRAAAAIESCLGGTLTKEPVLG